MSKLDDEPGQIIWALFSVENDYSQPDNNLVAWWRRKPDIGIILNMIGGAYDRDDSVVAAAHIFTGDGARVGNTDYRLESVLEGSYGHDREDGAGGSSAAV